MIKRDIVRTVDYPYPAERVWEALTSAEALSSWLMPNDFVAEVGHEFTFTTDPGPGFDGIVHCEVLSLDPPRAMTWSWRGGPINTTVEFLLSPIPTGTRLHFAQRGFRGPAAVAVSYVLSSGFGRMFERALPAYLSGAPIDPCHGWLGRILQRREEST